MLSNVETIFFSLFLKWQYRAGAKAGAGGRSRNWSQNKGKIGAGAEMK